MISAALFRKKALDFDEVTEQPHFDKTSFRVNNKIFATLDTAKKTASLKLPETEQSIYCLIRPSICIPATGAWGRQGWTIFDLEKLSQQILSEALKKAYLLVSHQEKKKSKAAKIPEKLIQTLHPDKNKTNKRISLEKYSFIKDTLLKILQSNELTHTELMEALYQKVKDSFEGGVQWYGETVKLDLEARKILERIGSRPEKYRLRPTKR